jgi:hypothetical protein
MPNNDEDLAWYHSFKPEYWRILAGRASTNDRFNEKDIELLQQIVDFPRNGRTPTPRQLAWLRMLVDRYESGR